VIGGHTVGQPDKFINTIERCHKAVPSPHFERISIRQREVDLWIQGILSVAINEDNGILILTASPSVRGNPPHNDAYFIDLKSMEMKPSKFRFNVGPINDWKNSYTSYE
jgi:hypothetical protein